METVWCLSWFFPLSISHLQENGYQLLFLSARSISQAYLTRQFLVNLRQVMYKFSNQFPIIWTKKKKKRKESHLKFHIYFVYCRMEKFYQMVQLLFPLMDFFPLCTEKVTTLSFFLFCFLLFPFFQVVQPFFFLLLFQGGGLRTIFLSNIIVKKLSWLLEFWLSLLILELRFH